MIEKEKVIVIVGPTASGKTALSIEIAKKFDGEIISADSRQVYTGLDIGTGKVTKEEMDGVPHHLIDVCDPKKTYTASDFVRDGRKAVADITMRKKLPIIAGGTFLYVDALLGRISMPEVPPDPELRVELEKLPTDALYTTLLREDPRRAENIDEHNRPRIIRALEIVKALGHVPEERPEEHYEALIIGIKVSKEELHEKIHTRLLARIDNGMIEEVKRLHAQGLTYERLEELGLEYRYIARYLKGDRTKERMAEELETEIRKYAKRQMTWLKRDKSIQWYEDRETSEIFGGISDFLD